jgi:hypothetical protein
MAVGTKLFTFATKSQSWTFNSGGRSTGTWDAVNGAPAGGLSVDSQGRNNTDESYWSWTGGWQSLGVPANATVTNIQLGQVFNKVRIANVANGGQWGPFVVLGTQVVQTAYATVQTAISFPGTVDTNWATRSGAQQSLPSEIQNYQGSVQLRYWVHIDLANDKNAQLACTFDQISLGITYTEAGIIEQLVSTFKSSTQDKFNPSKTTGLTNLYKTSGYSAYSPSVARELSSVSNSQSQSLGNLTISGAERLIVSWIEFLAAPGVETAGALRSAIKSTSNARLALSVVRSLNLITSSSSQLHSQLGLTSGLSSLSKTMTDAVFKASLISAMIAVIKETSNDYMGLQKSIGLTSPFSSLTNLYSGLGRVVGFQTTKPTNSYLSTVAEVQKVISSTMKTLSEMTGVLTSEATEALTTLISTQHNVRTALERTVALQMAIQTASNMTSSPEVARELTSAYSETSNLKSILQVEGEIIEYLISNLRTQTQVVTTPQVTRKLTSLVKSVTESAYKLVLTNALRSVASSRSDMLGNLSVTAATELISLMKTVSDVLSSPSVERGLTSTSRTLSTLGLSLEAERLLNTILKSGSNIIANLTVTGAGFVPLESLIRTLHEMVVTPSVTYALKMAPKSLSQTQANMGLQLALSVHSLTDTGAIFRLYSTKELATIANFSSDVVSSLTSGTGLSSEIRTLSQSLVAGEVDKALIGLFSELTDSYGILSTDRALRSLIRSTTNARMALRFLSEQLTFGDISKMFFIQDIARKFVNEDMDRKFIDKDFGIQF